MAVEKDKNELAVIVLGSESDEAYAKLIGARLNKFSIENVFRGGSAHTSPWHVLNIIREYENQPQNIVYVTIAGRSDALSAFIDGQTRFPVIAAPPFSEEFGIMKYLSSLDVPSGIGTMTAIYPETVAIAVAKIFALQNPEIAKKIIELHEQSMSKKNQFDKILKLKND